MPKRFKWAQRLLAVSLVVLVVMSGVLLRAAIQVEATSPQAAATAQAALQNLDAEEKLLDAQVAARSMPKRLANRLRITIARTRSTLTQQVLEQRFEEAAEVFD